MVYKARKICKIALYIVLFYIISLTLGFFSSYVYSKKNYNFRFPLFITSMQNILHFLLSTFCIRIIKKLISYRKCRAVNVNNGYDSKQKNTIPERHTPKEAPLCQDQVIKTSELEKHRKSSCNSLKKSITANSLEKSFSASTVERGVDFKHKEHLSDYSIYKTTKYEEIISGQHPSITKRSTSKFKNKTEEIRGLSKGKRSQKKREDELHQQINFSIIQVKEDVSNHTDDALNRHDGLDGDLHPFYGHFHKKSRSHENLGQLAKNVFPIYSYRSRTKLKPSCKIHSKKCKSLGKNEYIVRISEKLNKDGANRCPFNNIDLKDMKLSSKQRTKHAYIFSYISTTLTCAITAAIDIGLSSHALRTVSLAFYTMVKSSAPVFVLLSGFLFGIEQPSIKLFLTIFTIGAGVFLTTIKADSVNHTVNLCLNITTFSLFFASFMGGFRWAFVQYLIQKRRVAKRSILYTIKELCLPIGIILFIFSCYFEGVRNILTSEFFRTKSDVERNIGFILLSGFLSFCLLVSEFLLVSETSVVFLSVAGIVKELIIVFISVCKKEIRFDPVNYGGLTVSILGMIFYNVLLVKSNQKCAKK